MKQNKKLRDRRKKDRDFSMKPSKLKKLSAKDLSRRRLKKERDRSKRSITEKERRLSLAVLKTKMKERRAPLHHHLPLQRSQILENSTHPKCSRQAEESIELAGE